jgi:hydroxymethylpyrimidine/phosphomethylpyrimidine kinase
LPLAAVVTPNAPEATALLDMEVAGVRDMREAARLLVAAGARAALIKGGHLEGPEAVDVLYDGREWHELRCERVAAVNTHGTGCMTAAAVTVGLAEGRGLFDSVARAKRFVTTALVNGLSLGRGEGPANPLAWLDTEEAAGVQKEGGEPS